MIKIIEYSTLKKRIVRAISKGNHEPRYIIEYCKCEFQYYDFCKAISELQIEGVITSNDTLRGYFLAKNN